MAPSFLPTSFQESYLRRSTYPQNLIQRTVGTYPSALAAYATRLDLAEDELFEKDISKVEVPFRDLKCDNGTGKDLDKLNIHTPEDLTRWLGIRLIQDPNDPQSPVITVERKDPKLRFIYIYGKDSRARLKITRPMLMEIFTHHQVMPDFIDFITVFGLQSEPRDLKFSSFREHKSLRPRHARSSIDSLGRSGKQYQLCYNLKGVTARKDGEYSIRQAAFYHRFDVDSGNTLWIVTKGGLDIQERFKELTGKGARPEDKAFETTDECFRSSLSAHLLFCHWSTEDWRGYIKWLENTIEEDTLMAVLGPTGKGHHHHVYTTRDIQRLQRWAEKVRDVSTLLKANVVVMTSLRRFYTDLRGDEDFVLGKPCSDDIAVFISQLGNIMDDFKLQIDRADSLVRTTADRTELVKQHRLERLNLNMENEAIIVRIITIVTLVYLPATFVSTFFSTDVVKYQGEDAPGGNFSTTAMVRWLQVTLPLTLLTIAFAYVGKIWAEKRWQRDVLATNVGNHQPRWTSKLAIMRWSPPLPLDDIELGSHSIAAFRPQ